MSLAELFAEAPEPSIKGPRCSVGRLLASLPEADADVLRQVMADDAWTAKRIAERLRHKDIDVSQYTLNRHRNGECLCRSLGIA